MNAMLRVLAAIAVLATTVPPGARCATATAAADPDTLTTGYDVAGVRVIQRITDRNDIVSVRLYLLGGSRQLKTGTQGIEALLMRTSQIERADAVAAAGAHSILEVGRDWTVTGFQTLRRDLTDAWNAWVVGVTEPKLSGLAVGQARGEMLSDARRRYGDPDARVETLAWQNLFRNHPYRFDPYGTVQSISGLWGPNLSRYAHDQLVKSRMLVVVVGNVPQDSVRKLVAGSLGTLPAGSYVWELPPPVQLRPNAWNYENRLLPTNYILGYIVGPPPTDPSYFAFEVATNLLSGRLNDVIRTENSLSYAVYASFQEAAIPTAAVYATSADPAKVFSLMIDQVEWLQTLSQVPGWALNHYLDQFVLDQLTQNLTNDAQAQALARAELYFGDYRLADQYVAGLRHVKPDDIRKVAIRYMRAMQLGYLGNTRLMSFR
jgi:zinc protease